MARLIFGVFGALLAVAWFLYGLGFESTPQRFGDIRDSWYLARIPALWFFGVEIPRMFVLFIAVSWFCGALLTIASSFNEITTVHTFVARLRAGQDASQLLQEDLRKVSWSNQMCELAAHEVIGGKPYSAAIQAIMQGTGSSVDEAVLSYKLTIDCISERCALMKQAMLKVGSKRTVPEFFFPTVCVTESQKRSLVDRLTKVDISSTGNLTQLLTKDDLVYSYEGKLIWSAEQLEHLAGASGAREKVRVGVLRRVKTTNNHPIMGVADEYAWLATQFEIDGGPIGAKYETQGVRPQGSLQPVCNVTSETSDTDFIRLTCITCRKRLKCPARTNGKKVRCPNCQSLVRVSAEGS